MTAQPAPHERVTSAQTLALVAGLGILLVAQSYLSRQNAAPGQAKVLFLIGLLLVLPAAVQRTSAAAGAADSETSLHLNLRRIAPLLVLGAALAIVAAAYASRPRPLSEALVLWLLALTLFFVLPALVNAPQWYTGLRAAAAKGRETRKQAIAAVVLVAIIALAAYLRLFDLVTIPPFVHGDEAEFGLDAITLRDGRAATVFDNAFQDMPRLTGAPAALAMRLLPADPLLALRLSAVISGLISLPFLWLLARMFVSRPAALLAVFLLAVARVDIHFSRTGLNNIQVAPITVAAVYFLLRAIRNKSVLSAVVCGVIGGLGLYTYFSARVIPFIVAAALLFVIASDRANRRVYVKIGLVTLVSALVVFAPQLGYYMANSAKLLGHQSAMLVWNNMQHVTGGNPAITLSTVMERQIEHTFWGLNYYQDSSGQYGARGPLLDTITGILMFVGLVIALWRWRHVEYFTLLVWFVLGSIFTGVLVVGPPNAPRLCVIIPLACLLAGIAVQRIWDVMRGRSAALGVATAMVGFVLLPTCALASNYYAYFVDYVPTHANEPSTEAGLYFHSAGTGKTVYALGTDPYVRMNTVNLLAPGVPLRTMRFWDELLPLRSIPDGDVTFLAMTENLPTMDAVRDYYPTGTLLEHRGTNGSLLFATYDVAADAIAQGRGLTGSYTSAGADGTPVQRRDEVMDFRWPQDLPQGISPRFSARWDGSLCFQEFAETIITLQASGQASLSLDGQVILSKPPEQTSAQVSVKLPRGWHALHIEQQSEGGSLKLLWQRPGLDQQVIGREFLSTFESRGLLTSYYAGASATGTPVFQAIEPVIFSNANTFAELTGGLHPFVATRTGTLLAPEDGAYTIAVKTSPGMLSLALDGQPALTFGPNVYERREVMVTLKAGEHPIELTYSTPDGRFDRLELWWAPPGQDMMPISPIFLIPGQR